MCQFQLTFTSSDALEPAFSCQIQLSVDLDITPGGLRLVVQSGSSCQPFTLPLNRVFELRIKAQNSAGSTTLAEQLRLSEFLVASGHHRVLRACRSICTMEILFSF